MAKFECKQAARLKSSDRQYLDRVANLGCVVCRNLGYGFSPAVIHHIREGQGVSQRASHFLTIPLCPKHHTDGGEGIAFHANKKQWQSMYGSELDLLGQTIKEVFEHERQRG